MSTLAIPPKRVQLYRVLWDRWIIVLRILLDLGAMSHPVKWRAVADTLLVDKKTCQKYIAGLLRDGHLAQAGEGVMLTQAGMDVLLDQGEGNFSLLVGGINTGENVSPLVVEVVNIESESVKLTSTTPKLGKNPGEKFSPQAKLVIEHIPDLFDSSKLTTEKLPPIVIDEIFLGIVAYAYDKRTTLNSPVGFIHYSVSTDKRPGMDYCKNYADYLPESFLEAIGLLQKVCPRCEAVFQALTAFEAHWSECIMTQQPDDETEELETPEIKADSTVTVGLKDGQGLNATQAWQSVLGQLQTEMPRHTFETWVRDARAVHYQDNVLRVGVVNAYARDWLENRLQSTVERLLVGILNREVTVQFVVAVETEVE